MKTTIIKGKSYIVRVAKKNPCKKCCFTECYKVIDSCVYNEYYQKDTWFNRIRTYLNL